MVEAEAIRMDSRALTRGSLPLMLNADSARLMASPGLLLRLVCELSLYATSCRTRTASLSKRVATARLRLSRLMPHSTAWRCR